MSVGKTSIARCLTFGWQGNGESAWGGGPMTAYRTAPARKYRSGGKWCRHEVDMALNPDGSRSAAASSLERGVIGREIRHILVAQAGGHALHHRVVALARFVVFERLKQFILAMAGQFGIGRHALSARAVTGGASGGLRFAGRGIPGSLRIAEREQNNRSCAEQRPYHHVLPF